MSIGAASEARSLQLANIKTVANDNRASGKSGVRLFEGTFKINGQDISIFKNDKLSDIVNKVNKIQDKSGVKAVITGKGDGQRIELRSVRDTVEILDKNGVLSDIVDKGYLGTEKSNLMRVVPASSAKFSEVNVFYQGKEESNIVSPLSLLSDDLLFSLRKNNGDDYLYYFRPRMPITPAAASQAASSPNNASRAIPGAASNTTTVNTGANNAPAPDPKLSNPGFGNIAFGLATSMFQGGKSLFTNAVHSALDKAANYLL